MKLYTHRDSDGMLWRFEGSRPISKLADEVLERCGEFPKISFGVPVDQTAMRKAGMPEYEPAPNASQVPCTFCKTLCWQGPRQLALVASHPEVSVVCARCAMKLKLDYEYNIAHLGGIGGKLKQDE